jgi:hypothetical protein
VPNPNCPECHGTGIYRGGLHGDSSPCSICSPVEIPFGEGVTVAPEPPLPGSPPIVKSIVEDWDHGFLRTIWRESWLNAMNYKGSAVNMPPHLDKVVTTFGYWAYAYRLRIPTRKLIPVSETRMDSAKELANLVRQGVHAALPLAVWRTAPPRFPMWDDGKVIRPRQFKEEISETVFINPDPVVHSDNITFHYYAEWVRG